MSKSRRSHAILLAATAAMLFLIAAGTEPAPAAGPGGHPSKLFGDPRGEIYVPGEILIKFKESVTPQQRETILTDLGALRVRNFRQPIAHVKLGAGMTTEQVLELYRDHPLIEYVEPNYILRAHALPDDPDFDLLWGLRNTGQTGGTSGADIDVEQAWEVTTGSHDVVVGVIDTGVDYTHPDLADNIWINPGEIPDNDIDDDSNGYVDDVRGWDFVNDDNDPMDDHSHGTHVSGTIGAVGDNGIGVVGVSWKVRIIPLKFLNSGGTGDTAGAIAALEYAAAAGASITNNSWGGSVYSRPLLDAINAAADAGVLVVTSAGNDSRNTDMFPQFPSSFDSPNIVAVAATDHFDGLAWFSNYGFKSVDLGAPGDNTYSTMPGNGYGYKYGTSMAAPHVCGVAALIKSVAPHIGVIELKNLILNNVESIPSLAGITATGGKLSAVLPIAIQDLIPPGQINALLDGL